MLSARSSSSLLQHRQCRAGSGGKPAAAAPCRRAGGPRRGSLQVVAYRSELSELLLQRANRYAEVTGAAGVMTDDEVGAALGTLLGPRGVTFLADGVVYPKDRVKDVKQLVGSLQRQHAAYEHLVYRPVVSAVNEEQGVVFTAVYYVLRNRGPVFGASEPTGRISKGFLVDKMSFDRKTGHLVSSLVTRQLTLEERDALLEDPTAWQPAVVEEGELVDVPDIVAGPNDYKYMGEVISKWAGVWSSEASLDVLPQVLAPDCRAHDGYGLANKANGILWQVGGLGVARGPEQAREVISRTHDTYDNRNQLVSYAVSFEHKLGFHHWRANAVTKSQGEGKGGAKGQAGGERAPVEGVGLICFNKHLQIRDVYEFTMKPYKNIRPYVPKRK
ncbi:hypothetical protein GPECTOR_58g595 [Gonium pectorale]|uniref:Uncharacterized protein n=1 Tax=Gonium pectorale TaxID=33097 RepID=A0A150G5I5_GONPE|nr:hypothetical protein GPECTOR_58g595 [Gonium pectorale]|eukprot:KXZ45146.1 hypothetical protein GPECTOR_58g595 [Gonium pectorale]